MNIFLWIILGITAGWLADVITSRDHDVLENITLGIIGAFIGGFIISALGQPGITGFTLNSFLVVSIGSISLISIGRLFHKVQM